MTEQTTVWVDGQFFDPNAPTIAPLNHGILVGDGVFETTRVHAGVPFAITRHLDRLERSAAGIGLTIPDRDTLRAAMLSTVEKSGRSEGRLRLTIVGGVGPLGSPRGDTPVTTIVAYGPLGTFGPTMRVVTVPWCRNERGALTGLKTTSYAENVVAVEHARARGADEAILANTRDELCEATAANVFVVLDGVLCTPPLTSGCLAGITRALVLEGCERAGIATYEAPMPMSALTEASEVFVTGSVREIVPVTHVDDTAVPTAPGPITEGVMARYADIVNSTPDP